MPLAEYLNNNVRPQNISSAPAWEVFLLVRLCRGLCLAYIKSDSRVFCWFYTTPFLKPVKGYDNGITMLLHEETGKPYTVQETLAAVRNGERPYKSALRWIKPVQEFSAHAEAYNPSFWVKKKVKKRCE